MSEEELEKLGLTKGELSTIIAKGLVNTFKDLANAKEGKIINIEEINELLKEKNKEIERLNNIIDNMEEELMIIYLDIMEYNEDYAKREIKKLKGVDKDVSVKEL